MREDRDRQDQGRLDAAGGVTNGVKFIWNAAKDLPAGFKAGGVRVKVTVEQ